MKLLFSATNRGPANSIIPVIKEAESRGHDCHVYATGNAEEADAFAEFDYVHRQLTLDDCMTLVRQYDAIICGVSGVHTPDGFLIQAANAQSIPSMSVLGQNHAYVSHFGNHTENLPTILGLMSEDCIRTAKKELLPSMSAELETRARIIGWTAFDYFSAMKKKGIDKENLLQALQLPSDKPLYVHFTQAIHPNAQYWKGKNYSLEHLASRFLYDQGVSQFVFEAASDLGLRLAVKPHPGEDPQYTKALVDRHNFHLVTNCDSRQLMLAADIVTAGKSTTLSEATLLDKNVGGMVPEITEEQKHIYPAIGMEAIPYTDVWASIPDVFSTLLDPNNAAILEQQRKNFSVDGKASARVMDLVESF